MQQLTLLKHTRKINHCNAQLIPPRPTYVLPPQIKNIAKYIWLCPPPLLCLLHINVTYTQSPTTPHYPCKVHTYSSTYTNSPISIHNKYNSHNDTHTTHTTTPPTPHTTTHTPTHTPQHIPLSPPHTHLHTYTTPNTLICTPSPHKHKALHYNIFKVSNLLQYTYCIAVPLQLLSTTTFYIRTLIKVPFGSYSTNHHNAIRQPLN